MPPIVIVLVTYERTDCAVRTIRAVIENLLGTGYVWYIADDGSRPEHMAAILEALEGQHVVGYHSERMGVGASMNRAAEEAMSHTDIVLWLEDDWELEHHIDIEPYIEALAINPDVGMVRLGLLPGGIHSESLVYNDHVYLQMWRGTPYAFSGNPHLRHRRWFEAYGPYQPRLLPGDTEVAMDLQVVRNKDGPAIWWPVEFGRYGTWGAWGHIGAVKTEDMIKAEAAV